MDPVLLVLQWRKKRRFKKNDSNACERIFCCLRLFVRPSVRHKRSAESLQMTTTNNNNYVGLSHLGCLRSLKQNECLRNGFFFYAKLVVREVSNTGQGEFLRGNGSFHLSFLTTNVDLSINVTHLQFFFLLL